MPLRDEDYEEVRKTVDPSLDARQLPDETIGLLVYAGRAERQLLRIDPTALTRTDPDEIEVVNLARILLTAANLIERIPFKRRERNGPYEYVNQGIDPEIAASTMRGQAYSLLANLPGVVRPFWTAAALGDGERGNVQLTSTPRLAALGIGWPLHT